MIVYHGSNSNFRKLKIAKGLVRCESTMNNEGLDIYFSTDRSVAESYGKYLYTLEINDKYLVDFRKKAKCVSYIRKIISTVYKNTGVRTDNYFSAEEFANSMYFGRQVISRVGKEIGEVLDSTEKFYFAYNQTTREKVYRELRKIDRELKIAYLFTYYIKNIGVIKCADENIVRIINKEKIV